MSLFAAFFTYIMIWWIALFIVLPWGNKQPDENETGMAYGAPKNPNLEKKLIVNSLLSLVILGAVLVVVELDLIDLRGKADAYEKILNS
jgi:predicted secreted protein